MGLVAVMMIKHLKSIRTKQYSVYFCAERSLDMRPGGRCFQTDTSKRLCIHKFTLFALFRLVTGGKIYFWDQDPVILLLQLFSMRFYGPWSENETKQV